MDKVALLINNRNSGYVFTDIENAHSDAKPYDLLIDEDVDEGDLENEALAVWLIHLAEQKLRVVSYHSFCFDEIDVWFPIPTPTLVADQAEYFQAIEQN